MRIGEFFLRLGVALVGWLMVYAHCLFLAVLPMTDCSDGGAGALRMTLISGVPTMVLAALLPMGRELPEINAILRWFGLPLLLLWPLALNAVLPHLTGATLEGWAVCGGETRVDTPASSAQRAWAPMQLALLALVAWGASRYWYPPLPRAD